MKKYSCGYKDWLSLLVISMAVKFNIMITIQTFHKYVNYWNNYTGEVNLQMIDVIEKTSTWANMGYNEPVKLYAIYLKDGEKVYTNLAGFRKVMKAIRDNKLNIPVKD